ncbi:MAG TPA: hypothetical protein VMT63_10215 [Bacteroidales bacterium]|nr:hypothetical protein [Bacteroidales bacterium]
MKKPVYLGLLLIVPAIIGACSRKGNDHNRDFVPVKSTWNITGEGQITWIPVYNKTLYHSDHIEMSGLRVSAVITYGTDSSGKFSVSREVIWPMLRTIRHGRDKTWMPYRAYLKRTYHDTDLPRVRINGGDLLENKVSSVRIDGTLQVRSAGEDSILLTRTFVPSSGSAYLAEQWTIFNGSRRKVSLETGRPSGPVSETGLYGKYIVEIKHDSLHNSFLDPGDSVSFGIYFTAYISGDTLSCSAKKELDNRRRFITEMKGSLQLITPDTALNTEFLFAKIRTAESIFETKIGLVHSPGGGRYYGGVWANDQVEYAGPFFPFLGYKPAIEASENAYRIFAGDMKPDFGPIWSSHEMEGDLTCCGEDRGDAAMFLYGSSRFLLALGDERKAAELFPAVKWAAEYNRRHLNQGDVVASQTDEMEGRIATGDANLATSSLCYGGLISAGDLAKSLNMPDSLVSSYGAFAEKLNISIEKYFGSDIEGYHTYKYFKEHNKLRHWICLPLTMGIGTRSKGTTDALLERLWTKDGLLVEEGEKMFWDRGTLYALRGLFYSGSPDRGLDKLREYTFQRLLGNHVPYPVEAWPEGDQAHLAAESALYCRIFTEGLFGIVPRGFRIFDCKPSLPGRWNSMELKHIKAFGNDIDVKVVREKGKLTVSVTDREKVIYSKCLPQGATHHVNL